MLFIDKFILHLFAIFLRIIFKQSNVFQLTHNKYSLPAPITHTIYEFHTLSIHFVVDFLEPVYSFEQCRTLWKFWGFREKVEGTPERCDCT